MNDITALAQREKFEAWFADDVVGAEVTFPAFEDGEYVEGDVYDPQLYLMLQSMWMAWQAARVELVETLESRTVTVRLPSGTGWASDPYNHGRNDGISECAKELRAAGINVEAE